MEEKIKLNVAETYHNDIGRGIVRIDEDTIKKLNSSEGDYILIKGKTEAIAKILIASKEDYGLNIIRMDS